MVIYSIAFQRGENGNVFPEKKFHVFFSKKREKHALTEGGRCIVCLVKTRRRRVGLWGIEPRTSRLSVVESFCARLF